MLHALQIDGRASFSAIGQVVGVSDQTVARRYSRLRSAGLLRVRGLLEPTRAGKTQWIVRVRCAPSTATSLATALAHRDDTSWVSLTAGGGEVVCIVNAPSDIGHPALLLGEVPTNRSVYTVDAQCVLHEFFGSKLSLINKQQALDEAQVEMLRPVPAERGTHVRAASGSDAALLRALEHDGRATFASLAATTGWSQSTLRRRIADLVDAHYLYFDVDFDPALLDLQMHAIMRMRVPAADLATVGAALAAHPEVGYVAATTGATNLYSAVSCPTAADLYAYLTERIASLAAVEHLETAPVTHTVKTNSALTLP